MEKIRIGILGALIFLHMPCYAYGASRQKNDIFLVTFIQYVISVEVFTK